MNFRTMFLIVKTALSIWQWYEKRNELAEDEAFQMQQILISARNLEQVRHKTLAEIMTMEDDELRAYNFGDNDEK